MSFQLVDKTLTESKSVTIDYDMVEVVRLKSRREAMIAEQQAEIDKLNILIDAAVGLGYIIP